ncbi:MAG: PEP-CTERM sorting domain-containing protein [Parerythrobacter sp.]
MAPSAKADIIPGASATSVPGQSPVRLRYSGVVSYEIEDKVALRNPDGSTTIFERSAFETPIEPGRTVSLNYIFDGNDPVFSNPSCGNSGRAISSGAASGPCSLSVRPQVTGALGGPVQGGANGANAPFLTGVGISKDSETGAFSLSTPSEYQIGFFDLPKYQYDSASQSILGLDRTCFDFRICPNDRAMATDGRLRFDLLAHGDFNNSVVPFSEGYRAGRVGFLDILGGFSFSERDPTPVPAPGMLLLFGLGALTVFNRRRIGKVVRV